MKKANYFLDKPEQIKISLTNVCNYRCIMCFNPTLKQPRGFMKDSLVFKILDDCRQSGIMNVALGATGEPFLHPKFADYLRHAKSLGLWVSTTSNCSLLTKELADQLISAELDRFRISIYSASKDEHVKYCGNNCFDQVVENVRYFLKLWHQRQSTMEVNLGFLDLPGINNYAMFEKLWKPIAEEVGLSFSVKPPANWGGQIDIKGVTMIGKGCYLEHTPKGLQLIWFRKTRCMHLRHYLQIIHTGEVLPCCLLPDSYGHDEIVFGDLNNMSIMDVWQSEKYKKFKIDHYNRTILDYPVCHGCSEIHGKIEMLLSLKNFGSRFKTVLRQVLTNEGTLD
ncbi:MAG: radical SAM protein [Deltaproteobacteria bacterium]|nr:radical SAM protein [Deltaproteobacteria bacterium]